MQQVSRAATKGGVPEIADGDYAFVQYALDDWPQVKPVVEALRAEGVRLWVDRYNIKPGQNWEQALKTAILNSAAVLVFDLSGSWSDFAARQLATTVSLAVKRGTPVFPILPDDQFFETRADLMQWQSLRLSYSNTATVVREIVERLPPSIVTGSVPTTRARPLSRGYVFLSYAEEDFAFVDRLKALLAGRGFAYWDYRESDRNYDAALAIELEGVILHSEAVACVLSPDWKQSRWALRELFFAEEAGKPYLLLLARPIGPTLATAGMTKIDFTTDQGQGFAKLERELERKGL